MNATLKPILFILPNNMHRPRMIIYPVSIWDTDLGTLDLLQTSKRRISVTIQSRTWVHLPSASKTCIGKWSVRLLLRNIVHF
jgi:hypothetical protein